MPGDALERAAEAVASGWTALASDAVSEAEVRDTIAAIVAAVEAHVRGEPGTPPTPTPLWRVTAAALRTELIQALEAPAVTPGTLAQLRALDHALEATAPGWPRRLEDRLDGPNGLELVVEVAHDLRSPLTSILFLTETMLRGRSGPLTELQHRQIGLIYSAAFGLNAVASDVVELVRGRSRLVDAERKGFSVAEVLDAVRDIVQPLAEEKGLTLLMRGPVHDVRLGHPAELNRVILNLTTNALKFTAEGEVEVRIEDGDGDVLHCAVRDTGRGIPEAAMRTLYEPFRRRQRPGEYAFSGSGLGLSICRALVEAMNGQLRVETTLGQGTTFRFDLVLPRLAPGLLPE